MRNGYVRNGPGKLVVLLVGSVPIIENDVSFLLESNHYLSVVNILYSWFAHVRVAICTAQSTFGIICKLLRSKENRKHRLVHCISRHGDSASDTTMYMEDCAKRSAKRAGLANENGMNGASIHVVE